VPSAIVAESLVKRYRVRGGLRKTSFVEALKGVSFAVEKGTIHALLGPNGAGKTTTVKIVSTLLLPDGGDAYVLGYSVTKEPSKVREHIGVVLDVSRGFYGSLSGYENLVFYALLKGHSFSDAKREAKRVLELVGLEALKASNRPYFTYSLGMRARLALAKALLTNPEVLLLDEPTLGLDVESQNMVRELLVGLAKQGKTILVTGHNMHEIERISSHATIINKGVVVASGTPEELKRRLGLLYKLEMSVTGSNVKKFRDELQQALQLKHVVEVPAGSIHRLVFYVNATREEIVSVVFKLSKIYDVEVRDLKIEEPSLEDAYLAVVGAGHEAA